MLEISQSVDAVILLRDLFARYTGIVRVVATGRSAVSAWGIVLHVCKFTRLGRKV